MKAQGDENPCPTFRPTRQAFEQPFSNYVRDIFARHPDLACFKVVPPKGWIPRKQPLNLEEVRINTPIKQHVFGKSGSYVCLLEEQRGMSAADFKRVAAKPEHQPPAKGHRQDELSERAFWSGVTNSPPLYGADTPLSLFDEEVGWGWNLRHLGCMLHDEQYDVPDIPGVTSPMTYFGMWKSFFGWHKEDIDLYSTNYLHFGAPKVWYCVSPKDNAKFDAMAQSLYPDLHRACHGFMRHKDILVSPKVLRAYNVPYTRAKQEAGEFMVLNAAAYHAGYNLGFNCAEAVNFAMPEWLEAGKAAVGCTCACLPEGVALDMGIFLPELRETDSSSSDEEDSEGESGSGSEEDEDSSEEEGEEQQEQQQQPAAWRRGAAAAAARRPAAKRTPVGKAAQAAAPRGRGIRAAAAAAAAAADSSSEAGSGSDSETPASKRRRRGDSSGTPKPVRTPKVPEVQKTARPEDVPHGATHPQWGKVCEEKPVAIVEREEHSRQLRFSLVHRLAKASSKAGAMWVGLLKEGPDGLFRPQGVCKLLQLGMQFPKIAHVRTEWLQPEAKRQGGWCLKTKQERILM